MPFDKALYPDCVEGPFGLPLKDVAARQLETLLAAHKATRDDKVCKLAGSAAIELGTEERSEVSKITTEAVDRDREVVLAKGVDLTAYTSNPIVLLNHDWESLPLGKALWVKSHGNGLTAKTQYAKRPEGQAGEWLPESVYSLIKQDMLPGKSIGFIPLDARLPEKSEIAARPELKDVRRIITKSILLEYSVVGIPSNPEALVQIKAFPALAAALAIQEIDPPADGLTLAEAIKAFEEFRKAFPTAEELHEAIKDVGGLKYALRDLRKGLLSAPKPPEKQPEGGLLKAVEAEFRKMFPAA